MCIEGGLGMALTELSSKSSQTISDENNQLQQLDNVGIKDLAQCDFITNQCIQSSLLKRFSNDICYTNVGCKVLMFVNPSKELTIYSDSVKKAFADLLLSNKTLLPNIPPHVYGLVNRGLSWGRWGLYSRQTILLTGESGSGKSVNFLEALDYIHFINNSKLSLQIVNYNKILDLLGNSFLSNGRESTRYMKLLELEFDFLGKLAGAQFFTYQLEKWRVNYLDRSNFHIFYVLIAGCESSMLKSLGLVRNMESYRILNKNNSNNNNHHKFDTYWTFFKKTLMLELGCVKFSEMLKILASILKLGNVQFVPTTNLDGTEGVDINFFHNNSQGFGKALESLLDIKLEDLIIPGDSEQSNKQLEKLLENLYTRLFSWLTRKLNLESKQKPSFKINVLDFLGRNSGENRGDYESLLSNYLNVKVQFLLVDLKLRFMQEEIISEGFEWILVDTGTGQDLGFAFLGAVEGISKTVLSIVDNVEGIVEIVKDTESGDYSQFRVNGTTKSQSYSIRDFNKKNIETLCPILLEKLSKSKNSLLSEMYSNQNKSKQLTNLKILTISTKNCIKKCEQVVLSIRCINPSSNEFKLESSYVKYQLGYHRVLDYLKVIKNSHFEVFGFSEFLKRYKLLSLKTWPRFGADRKLAVFQLLSDLCFVNGKDFNVGNSKVFLKNFEILGDLEDYRRERLDDLAGLIQKTFRCWRVRKRFLRMRNAQITIANYWDHFLKRKKATQIFQLKKFRKAVGVIQRGYIAWKRRMYLSELRIGVLRMGSPVCKDWPFVPSYLQETNSLLKILFHRWRCREYREKKKTDRARLNEKATASSIFKGNKLSYPRSVSHPFLGDYIRLRQNSQWRRTAMFLTSNTQGAFENTFNIVFADLINKITRSSGKFVPIVFVVTTSEILILDPRTLQLKQKLNFSEISSITMSPYNDDLCIFHIIQKEEPPVTNSYCLCSNQQKEESSSSCVGGEFQLPANKSSKGDLIIHTCHLIELVTKVFLVHKNYFNATNSCNHLNHDQQNSVNTSSLKILFSNCFPATFGNQCVEVNFKSEISENQGNEDNSEETIRKKSLNVIPPSQIKIQFKKKYAKMEFSF